MLKRCVWLAAIAVLVISQLFVNPAVAAELDEATRTIKLNEEGDTLVLSLEQVARGRKQFNYACATCHSSGITKTNPTVGLDPESLAGALPQRNNLEALVDYLENPTTYDGLTEISQLHPSLKSTDIYPKMRSLTEDDLVAISGHILLQPKVIGPLWGGGKSTYSAPGTGEV
ncbi:photosystem II cytochrome c-550 [Oscillatoria sp. CS-180]|uniref:photosystem II cytochrome c-550 n=1 Tax=Oscillatoria sp. CS-180 TaxID=3021720 RepID=UPI00232E3A3E|nr:photosystem II cytochrome c-550 [Oscillatoria sp. CS-180]MDB9528436.1 photosystem II cytochrome c-550 [Oscillatoria sp. CS-180]